jgi:molecular chaperone DnaJ
MNYYKILGISSDAGVAAIRSAFRKLAKSCHPDTGTGQADDFVLIKKAFDILSDPKTRAEHDRKLGLVRPLNNAYRSDRLRVPPENKDVFDDLVEVVADRFKFPMKRKLFFELYLSDYEFKNGASTTINLPITKICPACFGFGGTILTTCGRCAGAGIITNDVDFDLALTPPLAPGDLYQLNKGQYQFRFRLKRGA